MPPRPLLHLPAGPRISTAPPSSTSSASDCRRAPVSPPGAVVFATEPIAFAVRERLAATDLDAGQPGLGVAVWFKVDAAQALYDQLIGHGVPIVTAPFDGPFGRTFAIEDPDGYVVTLHDGP